MIGFATLGRARAHMDELRQQAQRERLAGEARARNRTDKGRSASAAATAVQTLPLRKWRVAPKGGGPRDPAVLAHARRLALPVGDVLGRRKRM